MMHTDMAIIESMVAARQEQVATTIWESHRPIPLVVGLGSVLIRLGQWLKADASGPMDDRPFVPSRKRPLLA